MSTSKLRRKCGYVLGPLLFNVELVNKVIRNCKAEMLEYKFVSPKN